MLTLRDLIDDPERLTEIGKTPALIAAATKEEVIIADEGASYGKADRSSSAPDPTALFSHETMAMMRASRAEQVEQLARQVRPEAAVWLVRSGTQSVWAEVTLGRSPTADITIDDPTISSMHAAFEIEQHDNPFVLKDTSSSNGTFLNRERLQPLEPTPIKSGDCLRFGHTITYFVSAKMLGDLVAALRAAPASG